MISLRESIIFALSNQVTHEMNNFVLAQIRSIWITNYKLRSELFCETLKKETCQMMFYSVYTSPTELDQSFRKLFIKKSQRRSLTFLQPHRWKSYPKTNLSKINQVNLELENFLFKGRPATCIKLVNKLSLNADHHPSFTSVNWRNHFAGAAALIK